MSADTKAGWIEEIPRVEIELLNSGNVRVTDEHLGESYSVDLHPIHLRLIAEKLGLVNELSDTEAQALRAVDKLTRRLKVLHERIVQMDKWLWEHSDHEEADISVEIWYSSATLELSAEFQAEIAEASRHVTPRHVESQNNPRNGGLQDPQKRGTSAAAKPNGNPDQTQRVSKPGQMEILA